MAWRWRSAAVIGGAALMLGAVIAVTADPEARDEVLLDLAPKHFRDAKLQRFTGPTGAELYLVGTIHGRHLTTPCYRLAHLAALLAHLQPDLVMVESRPDEMARGNLGDGPIEALYADLTAREQGAAVAGVDWWTMNPDHQIDSEARESRIADLVTAHLTGARRAVLMIGYAHLPDLRQRLIAAGFRPAPLSGARKDALFALAGARDSYPAGMAAYLQRRIVVDQATLATTTDPYWRERLQGAIAAREKLLRTIDAAGERGPAARIAGAPPRG